MWSLLKFFALTYGVSWACFFAAVAMSHASASAIPALAAGRWLLLLLGTFVAILGGARGHGARKRNPGNTGITSARVRMADGRAMVFVRGRLYGSN